MNLQENKIYTSQEIAEWFGITYKTFRNSKAKKLNELSLHCQWSQPKRGQYFIEEVYEPTYNRHLRSTYNQVEKALPQYLQKIDTCINVGTKINREVFKNKFTDKYIGSLVGQIMKGNPDGYQYKPTVGMKKGVNGYATFRLFTQEEEKLYFEIISEYVDEIADDKSKDMKKAIADREAGKITNKQFNSMDFNLASGFDFMEFRARVQEKLNLTDEEYANRLRDFEEKILRGEFEF